MANYGVYVTVAQLRRELTREEDMLDDGLLKQKCERASRLFDQETHRHFFPIVQTRTYDHPEYDYSLAQLDRNAELYGGYGGYTQTYGRYLPSRLMLDDDLLEITTLTTANGDTTIAAGDIILKTGRNSNYGPYRAIELKTNGTNTTFDFSGTTQDSNSVTGIWGYHEDWDNAWFDTTQTVLDNPLSSSATTLTVTNASYIGIQNLIRIESEYLYVTNRNPSANTLTVIRGVNGSTAAIHVVTTQVDVYQPMLDIVEIVTNWAVFLTRLRNSPFGVGGALELGQTEISSLKRSDLYIMSKRYRRRSNIRIRV